MIFTWKTKPFKDTGSQRVHNIVKKDDTETDYNFSEELMEWLSRMVIMKFNEF